MVARILNKLIAVVFMAVAIPALAADSYWFEAETPTAIVAPMQVGSDPNASGGQYVLVPNGSGADSGGFTEYTVTVATAADYVLWGRILGPTGQDDSFYVSVDGGAQSLWATGTSTVWVWGQVSHWDSATNVTTDPVVFTLSAGTHTIRVTAREDGAQLDKLLLTNDLAFIPTGTGEPVSPPPSANGFAPLTWEAPVTTIQVDGYKIYVSQTPGSYPSAGIDVGNVLTFTVPNLLEGETYYFVATAYGPTGESFFSNEVSKTIPIPSTPPPPPANLQVQ